MTDRIAPQHCPYCADTDLRPHETDDATSGHGAWECRSCLRAFRLSFLGHLRRPATVPGDPS